jgi:CxxC motif-containing protein (DUF1111 family)
MNRLKLSLVTLLVFLLSPLSVPEAQFRSAPIARSGAKDPGVRLGNPGAGLALDGLTTRQGLFFEVGKKDFEEVEEVDEGVGPRFNAAGCAVCHSQPAVGGTSPAANPLMDIPKQFPGNVLPPFITADGPVREARFKRLPNGARDGGVHNLFVITGHPDAAGCEIAQEDFAAEMARNNVIFRIPTPVFGAGLIEQIPDYGIRANAAANGSAKQALGIRGRPNHIRVTGDLNTNGNDGTISRFGWKAQNKSLLLFSGEAYNVEMGITNELFQTERDETEACWFARVPNDVTDTEAQPTAVSAIENFSFFMRFLAPPTPSPNTPGGAESIGRGRAQFERIGCALCHTPTLRTSAYSTVEALRDKEVNLFSDLLLHNMGPGLADDIVQGEAGPDEFRTAPLWGLGQRIFFLHDGRTTDLIRAIREHKSAASARFRESEANAVVDRFNRLDQAQMQDLLNFLRSL